ncbi:hypothetical protein ACN6K9_003940 [Streptomyces sp. SAS_267]|uniref:hypothetical protein n=1 Tax=Streptomyces sp. SAS_267 TaxID=3412750 RepID=UPI00403C4D3C
MSSMQNDQARAKSAGHSGLGRASACLFALGCFNAALYLAGLIMDGDRYVPMLESAAVLLVASWTVGAVHLLRIGKGAR